MISWIFKKSEHRDGRKQQNGGRDGGQWVGSDGTRRAHAARVATPFPQGAPANAIQAPSWQGVVIAAVIVAAALLLQVKPTEGSFTIHGYPGLAIVLFLAAAGGGVALTRDILRQDRRRRSWHRVHDATLPNDCCCLSSSRHMVHSVS